MDYITVKQAAEKWGLSMRRVQQICENGTIPNVLRPARDWLLPKDAEKPKDKRCKNGEQKADNHKTSNG